MLDGGAVFGEPVSAPIVVIGGGFSGLRAAVVLVDAGHRVTVLESRVGLGGRARSFTDPATDEVVDNGQHLFLGGYHRTLAFLSRLGTRDRLVFQDRLKVSFVEPGGKVFTLDCPPVSPPWHLILGVMRLPGIRFLDKLRLWQVWREVRRSNGSGSSAAEETVEGWLERLGQGERSRAIFWDPLTIAALNEDPGKACAAGLKRVLFSLMAQPPEDARLGMAAVGLSDLYTEQARRIIEEKGGQVILNRPVAGLEIQGERVRAVRFADGTLLEAEAVISAVPPWVLLRILPDPSAAGESLGCALQRFSISPIVSVNLWLDRPVTDALFVALIGCRYQWLFNKAAILSLAGMQANYVSLIISAAYDFIDRPNEELVRVALEDLRACFPAAVHAQLTHSQVVREREATVSLTVKTEKLRPGPCTALRNLFLAGDWTATGLPATVESAVVSGEACGEEVLKWLASAAPGQ